MNTVCANCQSLNRIPDDRIEDGAKCGRCGHELFDGDVINATGATLDKLLKDDLPVVVDFWAPWCGPCRGFAPVFEQAATEHPDVTFAKVNTDVEQELAGALGIRSIPTLMVFREKVLLFSQPGALSGGQLNELLAKIKEVDMEKVHQEIAAAQDSQDA